MLGVKQTSKAGAVISVDDPKRHRGYAASQCLGSYSVLTWAKRPSALGPHIADG